MLILAQAVRQFDWSIGSLAIAVVIIAAVVALVYVALRQFNVSIGNDILGSSAVSRDFDYFRNSGQILGKAVDSSANPVIVR